MKLKLFVISLVFILLAISAQAQFGKDFNNKEENSVVQNKFFTGGSIGFWMWPRDGYVYISPLVGYHISPSFDVGTRFIYSYYWYNYEGLKFDEHDFGGGVFGRYYMFFYTNLFAHIEYEFLSHQEPVLGFDYTAQQYYLIDMKRIPINNFYIGGGLRQWMSNNAYVSLLLLFNLNETEYSPSNPIIRIGFGVGL